MNLPKTYIDSLHAHFDSDLVNQILTGLGENRSVSVRVNPCKPIEINSEWKPVPWNENGYLLPERPAFSQDPLFHAGSYYVQDSSSMILSAVLKRLVLPENPLCLDACAAPGGKSTLVLDHLNGQGFLIANEIDEKRQSVLQENLLKWGRANHACSSLATSSFKNYDLRFDLAVVDAPCSGEGMFRKDSFAVEQWNEGLVASCTLTQREILDDLKEVIKEDGFLIYSTCTMNPHENEEQVIRLLESGDFSLATPPLAAYEEFLHTIWHNAEVLGHYLLPGISTGEGLFIAVLKKRTAELAPRTQKKRSKVLSLALSNPPEALVALVGRPFAPSIKVLGTSTGYNIVEHGEFVEKTNLPIRRIGLPGFEIKGKSLVPDHGLAMMEASNSEIDLNTENALSYLRKETLSLPPEMKQEWAVVAFKGRQLGWIKNLGNRANNYYPYWLRLRS